MPQVQPLEDRWLLSTIIDLGANVSPTAVNASGQVVGNVPGANRLPNAFFYSNGTLTDLGTLPGFNETFASAINDNGLVVGSLVNNVPPFQSLSHAMLYNSQTGVMSDRGTAPGYTDGAANGINDSNQAIGYADMGSGTSSHGFLYSQGTLTDLGYSATAINASGQMVGGSYLHTDGQSTYLGLFTTALGINASGQVVGTQGMHTLSFEPFLWTPTTPNGTTGTLTSLGNLPGEQDGRANGINASGQVVGTYSYPSNQAFLYQNGTLTNLNDFLPGGSGWNLQTATAINNAGQVVGEGYLNGDTSVLHGFLLDLNDDPARHAAGVVAADMPALAQVTAPAATQLGTALDQAPVAASLERRDQPTTATVTASASTRQEPTMDSPLARPVSPTPAALDVVSTAALDVPL